MTPSSKGSHSEDGLVLVTGATGFTGGHLARALRKRGWRVRALVRQPSGAASLERAGIECVAGDLGHKADVDRAVAGCTQVYHIAALYRSAKYPDQLYWDVNVGGTAHVLEAARRHGVQRVVHCSTIGVHGDLMDFPADESAPFNAGDIYQQTKLEGEQRAAEAFGNGVPGVIFRPGGIYGPGDMRFLKLFRAVASGRFRMVGSGEVYYHLTYIDDLVQGILLCGERKEALGRKYILAGPRYTTIKELVDLIAGVTGVDTPKASLPVGPVKLAAKICERVCRAGGIEPPLHERRLDFFLKNRAFSIEKARRELGYHPRVDLPEGLRRTANWYADWGYLSRVAAE